MAINGETTKGMTPERSGELLRGSPGSTVTVLLEHEDQPINVTLTRKSLN